MTKPVYNFDGAISIVQFLEPYLSMTLESHIGLTGSVLFKGTSENDYDFIIYPHAKHEDEECKWNIDPIVAALSVLLKTPVSKCAGKYRDDKVVYFAQQADGTKLNFFFLS